MLTRDVLADDAVRRCLPGAANMPPCNKGRWPPGKPHRTLAPVRFATQSNEWQRKNRQTTTNTRTTSNMAILSNLVAEMRRCANSTKTSAAFCVRQPRRRKPGIFANAVCTLATPTDSGICAKRRSFSRIADERGALVQRFAVEGERLHQRVDAIGLSALQDSRRGCGCCSLAVR